MTTRAERIEQAARALVEQLPDGEYPGLGALRAALAAEETIIICNAESPVGHRCREPRGHAGSHKDRHGNTWGAALAAEGGQERKECDCGHVCDYWDRKPVTPLDPPTPSPVPPSDGGAEEGRPLYARCQTCAGRGFVPNRFSSDEDCPSCRGTGRAP